MAPFVELEQLRKSFGGQPVLTDISLTVSEGEILVLLGASGSGKTTLLRLISGFETPDEGAILVGGEEEEPAHQVCQFLDGKIICRISDIVNLAIGNPISVFDDFHEG